MSALPGPPLNIAKPFALFVGFVSSVILFSEQNVDKMSALPVPPLNIAKPFVLFVGFVSFVILFSEQKVGLRLAHDLI